MGDGARTAEGRKIIAELLEADDLPDDLWLARARDVRRVKGLPVFSELIRILTHLRYTENVLLTNEEPAAGRRRTSVTFGDGRHSD